MYGSLVGVAQLDAITDPPLIEGVFRYAMIDETTRGQGLAPGLGPGLGQGQGLGQEQGQRLELQLEQGPGLEPDIPKDPWRGVHTTTRLRGVTGRAGDTEVTVTHASEQGQGVYYSVGRHPIKCVFTPVNTDILPVEMTVQLEVREATSRDPCL